MTRGAIESLRIPAAFDEATLERALDIDAFRKQHERPVATTETKVAALRDATLTHLLTLHPKETFDSNQFSWPLFLYIPKGANARVWPRVDVRRPITRHVKWDSRSFVLQTRF